MNSATTGLDAISHYYQRGQRNSDRSTLSRETRSRLHNGIPYPKFAQKVGIEGKVMVRFTVDDAGQATNPQIVNHQYNHLDPAHGLLSEAALQTVKNLTFTPKNEGEELAGKEIGIQFLLPDDSS